MPATTAIRRSEPPRRDHSTWPRDATKAGARTREAKVSLHAAIASGGALAKTDQRRSPRHRHHGDQHREQRLYTGAHGANILGGYALPPFPGSVVSRAGHFRSSRRRLQAISTCLSTPGRRRTFEHLIRGGRAAGTRSPHAAAQARGCGGGRWRPWTRRISRRRSEAACACWPGVVRATARHGAVEAGGERRGAGGVGRKPLDRERLRARRQPRVLPGRAHGFARVPARRR